MMLFDAAALVPYLQRSTVLIEDSPGGKNARGMQERFLEAAAGKYPQIERM